MAAKEVFMRCLCRRVYLHRAGVRIISGGNSSGYLASCKIFGAAETHVHAVDIYFNEDGSYRDYDQNSPLPVGRERLKYAGSWLSAIFHGNDWRRQDRYGSQAGWAV